MIVSNLTFRFHTNHPLELAEVFAAFGFKVFLIAPIPNDVACLHELRGFKIIHQASPVGRAGVAWLVLDAIQKILKIKPDLIIGVNQMGYIPAYMASRLLPQSHLIYWAMELSRLSEGTKGFATRFQAKCACKADMVWSTGIERAKVMQEDWNLNETPYILPNTLVTPCMPAQKNQLINLMQHYEPDDRIVLYASSLSEETAVSQLIESAQYWEAGIKLVIVGHGSEPFINNMKQQIQRLNLGKKVEYLGSFALKLEVFSLFAGADLGIVMRICNDTSVLNTVYYTPSKLLEYAAFGLPVVCSDNPSLLFVENEGWGVCVNPNDPKAIASAVNQLMKNETRLKTMGIQAKSCFDKKYSMEIRGERLIAHLRSTGFLTN